MTTTAPILELVAPSKIKPHADNLRTDLGDLGELTDSIREQGVLEPLVVAPTSLAKTPYLLIAGHRRLAAAKAASLKQIPVVVRADLDTLQKQLEAMLVENGHRSDLSPVDEADGYQQLLTFPGYTQKSVAKATGRAATYVRDRLKIAKLTTKARDAITAGQVTIADAVALADFVDDEGYAELERAIGTDSFPWALGRMKRAKELEKARAKILAELAQTGVRVIDAPNDFPYQTRDTVAPLEAGYYGAGYAVGLTPDQHADCPGHAAIVRVHGEVLYVCDEVALQHRQASIDDPDGTGTDGTTSQPRTPEEEAASAAEAARVERYRRWREDAGIAKTLRREHMTPFIAGSAKLKPAQQVAVARAHLQFNGIFTEWTVPAWLEATGLTGPEGWDYESSSYEGDLAAAVGAVVDADPFPPMLGLAVRGAEDQLVGAPDAEQWPVYQAYVALLEALGYQLSEWERTELFVAPVPAAPPVEDVVESL